MPHTALAQITDLFAVVAATWAFAGGRWPERVGALAVAVDWVGGMFLHDPRLHHHLQAAIFGLDLGQAAILLGLVVVCRRTWVMWAAALAVLLVLTHVAVLFDLRLTQWAYLSASYVWSLGLLGALIVGVWVEGRRPAPLSELARALVTRLRPSTPSATARNRS